MRLRSTRLTQFVRLAPALLGLAAFSAPIKAAPAAPAPSAARLHLVDAQTPAGLRELFRPGPEPLPLLSAHRGGAGAGFPENCLATFEATLRAGWAALEIDLRRTKDGVIVLLHDATLDRTTDGQGPVGDRTLAELRTLRLKDRAGRLTDHRIPTLDEAMAWARGKTLLFLDKKDVPVSDVVRFVTERRAESFALLMAYSAPEAAECHRINPAMMLEVMMGTAARFEEFARTGVPWENVIAFVGHTATADSDLCRRIRERGASTMAGTSRNLDRDLLAGRASTIEPQLPGYRALLASGVDVIETDVPRELSPALFAGRPPSGTKARFFRLTAP
jgi:glycerophosphoryl diester phosphodiesterase